MGITFNMKGEHMKNILLYGTGQVANWYMENYSFEENGYKILGAVETEKSRNNWGEHRVYSLDEIVDITFDEIWLVNSYYDTYFNCLKLGVTQDKIVVGTSCVMRELKEQLNGRLGDVRSVPKALDKLEEYFASRCATLITRTPDRLQTVYYTDVANTRYISPGVVFINDDYFRYATFQLIVEEIKSNRIQGEVAELGVFRGRFSRCINNEFKDRLFYLFDTFEGFAKVDIDAELDRGFTGQWRFDDGIFENTSEKEVMAGMPYPGQCIVRKGYFPETIPDEEISYAFVSLDCDLYTPMLEGLKYFYPRLSEGGYMMIHDYTHDDHFLGVKEAIVEYEREFGRMKKVPLGDAGGTLVVCK